MVGLMDPSYEEIFNNSNQFVGVLTPDGTVRAANDTILKFTESNRKEIIGTKLWNVPGIRFSETVQRQVRADIRKGVNGESVNHELTIQGADRKAVINFSLQPLTDEHGEVTHLLSEGHDLTEGQQKNTVRSATHHEQTSTDLLVAYSRDADEPMSESVLHAFLALDMDIFERDSTLQDWIDVDFLDEVDNLSGRPITITTRLWGYTVELTAGEVRIYTDSHP
ncbi:PAS domain-containing protein [Salinibaculum salinum]|uniref:PAS domain-containing protein n=1 Tax=Salinibaculum salinum TaxID=3131996 RepID=UPI0030EDFF06